MFDDDTRRVRRRWPESEDDPETVALEARRRRRARWSAAGPFALLMAVVIGAALLFHRAEPEPPPDAIAPLRIDVPAPPAERTAALPPIDLDKDDAPHGRAMEWWYYNGILDGTNGQRYGFHVAVFVANGLIKHTVLHAALTDLRTGQRQLRQARTGGVPLADGAASRVSSSHGFDFGQEGWRVRGKGADHQLRIPFEGATLDLSIQGAQPALLHRAAGSATPGLLDFGTTAGISYYYSRPRMSARGELQSAGRRTALSGDTWFDHQWGDFDALALGWNWLALHLSDGSDLMIYQLFDPSGRTVMNAGTRAKGPESTPLDASAFELRATSRWTSPATQIAYPVEWQLRLGNERLSIKPLLADGEFDARTSSGNIYWEGPVRATGSLAGEGFLELSGYDRLKPPASSTVSMRN